MITNLKEQLLDIQIVEYGGRKSLLSMLSSRFLFEGLIVLRVDSSMSQ